MSLHLFYAVHQPDALKIFIKVKSNMLFKKPGKVSGSIMKFLRHACQSDFFHKMLIQIINDIFNILSRSGMRSILPSLCINTIFIQISQKAKHQFHFFQSIRISPLLLSCQIVSGFLPPVLLPSFHMGPAA